MPTCDAPHPASDLNLMPMRGWIFFVLLKALKSPSPFTNTHKLREKF
jgi:hypothetical protein